MSYSLDINIESILNVSTNTLRKVNDKFGYLDTAPVNGEVILEDLEYELESTALKVDYLYSKLITKTVREEYILSIATKNLDKAISDFSFESVKAIDNFYSFIEKLRDDGFEISTENIITGFFNLLVKIVEGVITLITKVLSGIFAIFKKIIDFIIGLFGGSGKSVSGSGSSSSGSSSSVGEKTVKEIFDKTRDEIREELRKSIENSKVEFGQELEESLKRVLKQSFEKIFDVLFGKIEYVNKSLAVFINELNQNYKVVFTDIFNRYSFPSLVAIANASKTSLNLKEITQIEYSELKQLIGNYDVLFSENRNGIFKKYIKVLNKYSKLRVLLVNNINELLNDLVLKEEFYNVKTKANKKEPLNSYRDFIKLVKEKMKLILCLGESNSPGNEINEKNSNMNCFYNNLQEIFLSLRGESESFIENLTKLETANVTNGLHFYNLDKVDKYNGKINITRDKLNFDTSADMVSKLKRKVESILSELKNDINTTNKYENSNKDSVKIVFDDINKIIENFSEVLKLLPELLDEKNVIEMSKDVLEPMKMIRKIGVDIFYYISELEKRLNDAEKISNIEETSLANDLSSISKVIEYYLNIYLLTLVVLDIKFMMLVNKVHADILVKDKEIDIDFKKYNYLILTNARVTEHFSSYSFMSYIILGLDKSDVKSILLKSCDVSGNINVNEIKENLAASISLLKNHIENNIRNLLVEENVSNKIEELKKLRLLITDYKKEIDKKLVTEFEALMKNVGKSKKVTEVTPNNRNKNSLLELKLLQRYLENISTDLKNVTKLLRNIGKILIKLSLNINVKLLIKEDVKLDLSGNNILENDKDLEYLINIFKTALGELINDRKKPNKFLISEMFYIQDIETFYLTDVILKKNYFIKNAFSIYLLQKLNEQFAVSDSKTFSTPENTKKFLMWFIFEIVNSVVNSNKNYRELIDELLIDEMDELKIIIFNAISSTDKEKVTEFIRNLEVFLNEVEGVIDELDCKDFLTKLIGCGFDKETLVIDELFSDNEELRKLYNGYIWTPFYEILNFYINWG